MKHHAVIVFDGECSVCSRWIDFLLRFDKREVFRFTARQSVTGARFAAQHGIPPGGVGSIIVVEAEKVLLRSDAVLRIFTLLGAPFSALGLFRIVPASWRDPAYDAFSRNRQRWFSKPITCRLPTPAERHRFL